ncbi:hypothetical protein [Bacillus sp. FJAT-49736]|uniref:hypothetical protein n=1 Tax=Bacillus sp. FJAT-49736 TaxID=2833582 RepID=UPI001BC90193|nr:hypothetical protein [Bacillus sp. FJAT-49736]MBS4174306.1 hypothetical protein [Bacillus sp. FJAT-49736]
MGGAFILRFLEKSMEQNLLSTVINILIIILYTVLAYLFFRKVKVKSPQQIWIVCLSVLSPGIGQFYKKRYTKGWIFAVLFIAGMVGGAYDILPYNIITGLVLTGITVSILDALFGHSGKWAKSYRYRGGNGKRSYDALDQVMDNMNREFTEHNWH